MPNESEPFLKRQNISLSCPKIDWFKAKSIVKYGIPIILFIIMV